MLKNLGWGSYSPISKLAMSGRDTLKSYADLIESRWLQLLLLLQMWKLLVHGGRYSPSILVAINSLRLD